MLSEFCSVFRTTKIVRRLFADQNAFFPSVFDPMYISAGNSTFQKVAGMKRRAGFQGALGAFSQEAVRQLLGGKVEVVPFTKFEEVFRDLSRGMIDAAVFTIA